MAPVSFTARLAQVPKKIPNAVHICQHMTKPPRIDAGAFSALNIGTVEPLQPIPIPSRSLVTNNCSQAEQILVETWNLRLEGLTLCDSTTDGTQDTEDSGYEDGPSTTEVLVEGIRAPASTATSQRRTPDEHCQISQEGRSDVRSSVYETLIPLVTRSIGIGDRVRRRIEIIADGNTQSVRE